MELLFDYKIPFTQQFMWQDADTLDSSYKYSAHAEVGLRLPSKSENITDKSQLYPVMVAVNVPPIIFDSSIYLHTWSITSEI